MNHHDVNLAKRCWWFLLITAFVFLVACGPSAEVKRQQASQELVTGLDGSSSECLTMFMTRYGDRTYPESQNLKPVCVEYNQTVVTMSLEQKEGTTQDVAYRVRVTYVQPQSQPVTVYQRTYWFNQNEKEGGEKKVQALVTLGAVRK